MTKTPIYQWDKLLREYIDYCDQMVDYNYPIPQVVEVGSDGTYLVRGDVRDVHTIEEPTLRGFIKWLEDK